MVWNYVLFALTPGASFQDHFNCETLAFVNINHASLAKAGNLFKASSKPDFLLLQVSSETWLEASDRQRSAGKSAKWIVVGLKPCLEYQFQIKVEGAKPGVSEAMFELPQSLGPASEDEIIDSGYKPEAATDFAVKAGANSASVSWSKSDCALSYDVGFSESGDNSKLRSETVAGSASSVNIGELKPCTRYETTITAVLGDEFSEDLVSSFATKPRLDAVANIKPTFLTTLDSAIITWETWQSVSCIDEYQVTLCTKATKQCQPTVTVNKAQGLPTVTFTAENLDPCTTYTFEIKPVYPDTKIDEKIFEFKTKSPSATTLTVDRVSAKTVSTSTMQVSWSSVECAVNYRVYQKAPEDDTWNKVVDTTQLDIPVDVTPCTRYNFAISAVMDNGEETEKSVGPEMISDLDERDPFEAPNLYIMNADRHADVSWGHADCITSYVVKVCQLSYTDCFEASVSPTDYIDGGEKDRTIRYKIENMDPCTVYTLETIPNIPDKIFTARVQEFTTTNGTPQPPENFKVALHHQNRAELTWSSVQCATGYKVYQRIDDEDGDGDEDSTTETIHDLKESYENLVPCISYFYSVSTLVAEQESSKTEWSSVIIPPTANEAPELKILSNENDNITLKLEPSTSNERCTIVEYELSYSSDGGMNYVTKTLQAADINADDIVLSFKGATTPLSIVRGRVKYAGSNEWSSVISTHEPGDHSAIKGVATGSENATLVPIVVGCLVAVAIVAVIAFFVVRHRRNRNLYDAEKAEANGKMNGNSAEETQKLNDTQHPEA